MKWKKVEIGKASKALTLAALIHEYYEIVEL